MKLHAHRYKEGGRRLLTSCHPVSHDAPARNNWKLNVSSSRVRRIADFVFALLLLLISAIPLLLIAILVKITSKGPVLHWSKRVGRCNHNFMMPKFRTMRIDTPQVATHLLVDADRYLTPAGGFLRKSSLDELPQLWSILMGELCFVGPRPALYNQNDLVELRTRYGIHALTPGVTGWAQINGRDELSIPEKVEFDREYLQKECASFDLKIVVLTVFKVFQAAGISH
jgi:O-antigen biosynthesis protein WbqP